MRLGHSSPPKTYGSVKRPGQVTGQFEIAPLGPRGGLVVLTDGISKRMNKDGRKSRLTSPLGGLILILNLDISREIDVGDHLEGNPKEERVPAPQCIDEKERCQETEEELGKGVHAVEK